MIQGREKPDRRQGWECRAERVRGGGGGGVENGGFAKMQLVGLPISRFLGP
ncbi:hypothetical protein [Rhizobium sp. L51/94]|uniref:hypothetical protein n=1 Tax=Rhizobium sp. L51/94 TaxID=2819999 RepID=UPI001C5B57E5|nr:hypothetical protein [Rhizobium sp. L51/94]QXZ80920.1 hypothetical protein J5274_18535 [Rhizobium sp. L51/94]